MSRYYLKSLSVEGFRGINNAKNPLKISFDPNKMSSIFGRNGSGKSSIFDALSYAFTGDVPRLKAMQKTEKPSEYYINKFHGGPAKILLEFLADDSNNVVRIEIERDAMGKRTTSGTVGDPEAFLRDVYCETLLLDYSSFNEFVMAKPLDRGREFSKLLGLGIITDMRMAFGALSDSKAMNGDLEIPRLQAELNQAKASARENTRAILERLSQIVDHDMTEDTFVPAKAQQLCLDRLGSIELLSENIQGRGLQDINFDSCKSKIRAAEGGKEREKLDELMKLYTKLESLPSHSELLSDIQQIHMLVSRRDELQASTKDASFKKLYLATQEVLAAGWSSEVCPLCENPWNRPAGESLQELLQSELGQFSEILQLDQQIEASWKRVFQNRLSKILDTFSNHVHAELAATANGIDALRASSVPNLADISDLKELLSHLEEVRTNYKDSTLEQIKNIKSMLPASLIDLVNILVNVEQISRSMETLEDVNRKIASTDLDLRAREEWQDRIKRLAADFNEAESQLIAEVINSIEGEVRLLFSSIMPGDEILPRLRREQDERLYLQLEHFFGLTGVDAVPLLSESYRNALGLAIFLAAARKRPYGGRFLVLDDVTSSFDSGHQTKLVETIYDHFVAPQAGNGLQVLVLTHDGLLEKSFDYAASRGLKWINIKLNGLPPEGLISHNTHDMVPRLSALIKDHLSQGEVDKATPYIRQYLEFRLLEVIKAVQIPVPLDMALKDDKHMVANLIDVIRTALDLHVKAGTIVLPAPQRNEIEKTILPQLMGNWVSHYESGAMANFSPSLAAQVVKEIEALTDQFKYTCVCVTPHQRKFYRSLSSKQQGCGAGCE